MLHVARDDFAVEDWLAADGDGRDVHDADWGRASPAILPAASAGCRAVLIIAAHDDPPPDCAAKVIGRRTWYDHGALALRRDGAGFVVDPRGRKISIAHGRRLAATAGQSPIRRVRRQLGGRNAAAGRYRGGSVGSS